MPENDFWRLIDGAGRANGDFVEELAVVLRGAERNDVRAFGAILQSKVAALQTGRHAAALAEVNEALRIGAGSDYFDYVAAAVVAAGRPTYEAVLADPTAIIRPDWDDDLGEALLALPAEVFDTISEEPYDDEPGAGLAAVHLHVTWKTIPPDMPVWRLTVGRYSEWISDNADTWRLWWTPSARAELDLWLDVENPHDQAAGWKIKAGKKRAEARFVRTNDQLPSREEAAVAEHDVHWVLEKIRSRFNLDPHPRLPSLDQLPPGRGHG